MDHHIDIVEQQIHELDPELLSILLRDETTGQNIRWACEDYASLGTGYSPEDQILPELITGENTNVIRPRIMKEAETQAGRTREKAEVFTPSWVCNKQNNLIDEAWLGKSPVFNREENKGWTPVKKQITFPRQKGRHWQDYVTANRMEITCGEAPYLVSRYDTVTGEAIPLMARIGFLDRKLRIISERVEEPDRWFDWAQKALQSCYAYDIQGDNVLLARENVLASVSEYHVGQFGVPLSKDQLRRVAIIIAWNIWQMNGLTYTAPFSEESVINDQADWFSEMGGQVELKQEIPCCIMDWQEEKVIQYQTLVKGQR
ncbi:MAG: restriction endonuclease subunit M [Oscillospiraceae bacterium]|nr:restriction endonuclease subunit M [Oscillospiraceae bacterium]